MKRRKIGSIKRKVKQERKIEANRSIKQRIERKKKIIDVGIKELVNFFRKYKIQYKIVKRKKFKKVNNKKVWARPWPTLESYKKIWRDKNQKKKQKEQAKLILEKIVLLEDKLEKIEKSLFPHIKRIEKNLAVSVFKTVRRVLRYKLWNIITEYNKLYPEEYGLGVIPTKAYFSNYKEEQKKKEKVKYYRGRHHSYKELKLPFRRISKFKKYRGRNPELKKMFNDLFWENVKFKWTLSEYGYIRWANKKYYAFKRKKRGRYSRYYKWRYRNYDWLGTYVLRVEKTKRKRVEDRVRFTLDVQQYKFIKQANMRQRKKFGIVRVLGNVRTVKRLCYFHKLKLRRKKLRREVHKLVKWDKKYRKRFTKKKRRKKNRKLSNRRRKKNRKLSNRRRKNRRTIQRRGKKRYQKRDGKAWRKLLRTKYAKIYKIRKPYTPHYKKRQIVQRYNNKKMREIKGIQDIIDYREAKDLKWRPVILAIKNNKLFERYLDRMESSKMRVVTVKQNLNKVFKSLRTKEIKVYNSLKAYLNLILHLEVALLERPLKLRGRYKKEIEAIYKRFKYIVDKINIKVLEKKPLKRLAVKPYRYFYEAFRYAKIKYKQQRLMKFQMFYLKKGRGKDIGWRYKKLLGHSVGQRKTFKTRGFNLLIIKAEPLTRLYRIRDYIRLKGKVWIKNLLVKKNQSLQKNPYTEFDAYRQKEMQHEDKLRYGRHIYEENNYVLKYPSIVKKNHSKKMVESYIKRKFKGQRYKNLLGHFIVSQSIKPDLKLASGFIYMTEAKLEVNSNGLNYNATIGKVNNLMAQLAITNYKELQLELSRYKEYINDIKPKIFHVMKERRTLQTKRFKTTYLGYNRRRKVKRVRKIKAVAFGSRNKKGKKYRRKQRLSYQRIYIEINKYKIHEILHYIQKIQKGQFQLNKTGQLKPNLIDFQYFRLEKLKKLCFTAKLEGVFNTIIGTLLAQDANLNVYFEDKSIVVKKEFVWNVGKRREVVQVKILNNLWNTLRRSVKMRKQLNSKEQKRGKKLKVLKVKKEVKVKVPVGIKKNMKVIERVSIKIKGVNRVKQLRRAPFRSKFKLLQREKYKAYYRYKKKRGKKQYVLNAAIRLNIYRRWIKTNFIFRPKGFKLWEVSDDTPWGVAKARYYKGLWRKISIGLTKRDKIKFQVQRANLAPRIEYLTQRRRIYITKRNKKFRKRMKLYNKGLHSWHKKRPAIRWIYKLRKGQMFESPRPRRIRNVVNRLLKKARGKRTRRKYKSNNKQGPGSSKPNSIIKLFKRPVKGNKVANYYRNLKKHAIGQHQFIRANQPLKFKLFSRKKHRSVIRKILKRHFKKKERALLVQWLNVIKVNNLVKYMKKKVVPRLCQKFLYLYFKTSIIRGQAQYKSKIKRKLRRYLILYKQYKRKIRNKINRDRTLFCFSKAYKTNIKKRKIKKSKRKDLTTKQIEKKGKQRFKKEEQKLKHKKKENKRKFKRAFETKAFNYKQSKNFKQGRIKNQRGQKKDWKRNAIKYKGKLKKGKYKGKLKKKYKIPYKLKIKKFIERSRTFIFGRSGIIKYKKKVLKFNLRKKITMRLFKRQLGLVRVAKRRKQKLTLRYRKVLLKTSYYYYYKRLRYDRIVLDKLNYKEDKHIQMNTNKIYQILFYLILRTYIKKEPSYIVKYAKYKKLYKKIYKYMKKQSEKIKLETGSFTNAIKNKRRKDNKIEYKPIKNLINEYKEKITSIGSSNVIIESRKYIGDNLIKIARTHEGLAPKLKGERIEKTVIKLGLKRYIRAKAFKSVEQTRITKKYISVPKKLFLLKILVKVLRRLVRMKEYRKVIKNIIHVVLMPLIITKQYIIQQKMRQKNKIYLLISQIMLYNLKQMIKSKEYSIACYGLSGGNVTASYILSRLKRVYERNVTVPKWKIMGLIRDVLKARNVIGFKLQAAGRITKQTEASTMVIKRGIIGNTSMRVYIDFAYGAVSNKYGKCGLKVWLVRNVVNYMPYKYVYTYNYKE